MTPPASSMLYTLDEEGNPVHTGNVIAWSAWMASHDRRLARDTVGAVEVSTVFLGLDHGWGRGDPVLWETMQFGGGRDDRRMDRYTSRAAALAGHAAWVERLKEKIEGPTETAK